MKNIYSIPILILLVWCTLANADNRRGRTVTGEWVRIERKHTHYSVTIDYRMDASPIAIGAEYMRLIQEIAPEFEEIADQYLKDLQPLAALGVVPPYAVTLKNSKDILPQLAHRYREELAGMAGQVSGGGTDLAGDRRLSKNEMIALGLLPDVLRSYSCTAISFWGENTHSGKTITGRNLDWLNGQDGGLNRLHAVTTIRQGKRSLTLVGFLGSLGVISAVNDDGVFAAILDSPLFVQMPGFEGKRSYYLDLRYALEEYQTAEDVAAFMIEPSRRYSFNHNILISDMTGSMVVENFQGGERKIRYAGDKMNSGIRWPSPDSIAAVNSFVLAGMPDNHTPIPYNTGRWKVLADLATEMSRPVDLKALHQIMNFQEGTDFTSHIYRHVEHHADHPTGSLPVITMQQVIYDSHSKELQAYFVQANARPAEPVLETIPLQLERTTKKDLAK